eukprot:4192198-Prymnesium_polylepis.1
MRLRWLIAIHWQKRRHRRDSSGSSWGNGGAESVRKASDEMNASNSPKAIPPPTGHIDLAIAPISSGLSVNRP